MSGRGGTALFAAAIVVVLAPLGCGSVFRGGSPGIAHDLAPDQKRALEQAENLAAGGDVSGAIRSIEPMLVVVPELVPVHRAYQDLRLRTEPREAVVEYYRSALAARPSPRLQLLLARLLPPGDEGDALTRAAAELAPDDPWSHFALGYRERSSGRLEAAEKGFSRALEIDPDFQEALLEGGETAYMLHDEETALDRFERLVALNPDDPASVIRLAAVLSERQEFDRAEDVLRASLERRSRDPDADVEIALTSVLIDQGRFSEADAMLVDLASRHPKSPTVAFNRAVVAEIHERDFAKALALYERYLTLGGDDTLRVSRWMEKIRAGDVRSTR